MFLSEANTLVWLCTEPCDMRKSANGLSALVQHQLQDDPLSGHRYVFINRRKTQMKILYFDRSGYAIWSKRLEQGQFVTRHRTGIKAPLSLAELQCLLEGVELKNPRHCKRFALPDQEQDSAAIGYNASHVQDDNSSCRAGTD